MKPHEPAFILELPALHEDNPRDFLAALGLLRMINLIWPETNAMLAWNLQCGAPVISTSHQIPDHWAQNIWSQLIEWRDIEDSPFSHGKIEAIQPNAFRQILVTESSRTPNLVWIYAALSAQLSHEKSGRRSEFIIESASRSVLNGVNTILQQTRNLPDIEADFKGTSTRKQVKNTSRWHPGEFLAAAYMASDPEDFAFRDHPTLNIFALLGLSFYPVVDTARGRLTSGMVPESGQKIRFTWPIWGQPLSAVCISSLLHHPALHSESGDEATLRALGITRTWRSRRFKANGDNLYFSRAEPLF